MISTTAQTTFKRSLSIFPFSNDQTLSHSSENSEQPDEKEPCASPTTTGLEQLALESANVVIDGPRKQAPITLDLDKNSPFFDQPSFPSMDAARTALSSRQVRQLPHSHPFSQPLRQGSPLESIWSSSSSHSHSSSPAFHDLDPLPAPQSLPWNVHDRIARPTPLHAPGYNGHPHSRSNSYSDPATSLSHPMAFPHPYQPHRHVPTTQLHPDLLAHELSLLSFHRQQQQQQQHMMAARNYADDIRFAHDQAAMAAMLHQHQHQHHLGGYPLYGGPVPSGYPRRTVICDVEFKMSRGWFECDSALAVREEEFVFVLADRGEDLGQILSVITPISEAQRPPISGFITRRATLFDVQKMAQKHKEEAKAVHLCRQKIMEHNLDMQCIDAEFQFDRKKLTFFYRAGSRVDFRELVRDLYKVYRTRIWLSKAPEGRLPIP